MVIRSPLVFVDGGLSELAPGDSVTGVNLAEVTSGSGIIGSGDLSVGEVTVSFDISANPSGLYLTEDFIGVDGAALASGEAALSLATVALSSGSAAQTLADSAQSEANEALASGNAALADVAVFYTGNTFTGRADSDVTAFTSVGMNTTGGLETVREFSGVVYPKFGVFETFLGIASKTVSSGELATVILPKSVLYDGFSGLTPGAFYYVDPTSSGLKSTASQPGGWGSRETWAPVARAISASGIMLLKPL